VASKLKKAVVAFVLLAALVYFVIADSAAVLVANDPSPSDVVLVLAGDRNDSRFWYAMKLMNEGYASRMILDVQGQVGQYGVSDSELAQAFVTRNASGRAVVCEVLGDSTFDETMDAARCLQTLHPSSVLLVTSGYHTRRALTIFRHRLPQYQWHVAALGGPLEPGTPWVRTADQWWRNRRWAKTVLDEWQKWIWWCVVDRWRA
jgi:uncharacterized SAM-binding protein YcdF (DUF218 family)